MENGLVGKAVGSNGKKLILVDYEERRFFLQRELLSIYIRTHNGGCERKNRYRFQQKIEEASTRKGRSQTGINVCYEKFYLFANP